MLLDHSDSQRTYGTADRGIRSLEIRDDVEESKCRTVRTHTPCTTAIMCSFCVLFLTLIFAAPKSFTVALKTTYHGRNTGEDNSNCFRLDGSSAPCGPGSESCAAAPFGDGSPQFHLMDQRGCAENDPNGPVFDPVHGVLHHFYQAHLAAPPGRGPVYGHFVSRDFVSWASLPVAIWNGIDSSVVWPPRNTKYDSVAIYTGSAVVVDGAGPDGTGPGVVQIYPGLCDIADWPGCGTGTVLAQAVPANYATDVLLTNWTKPSYNPIVENTERDPSTPWKTPSGEWRLRTYDSKVYGCASDEDLLEGKWYEIGTSPDFRTCECPSIYPLPESTPGFEASFEEARRSGQLPDTVQKTSCGGDWWQLGTYSAGKPGELGSFKPTPGWEDAFEQSRIDKGHFYASKDNEYPTLHGGTRRVSWGWATVPPASVQTLPREITFNAAVRSLQQYPVEELEKLRIFNGGKSSRTTVFNGMSVDLPNAEAFPAQGEVVVTFDLPAHAITFGVTIGPAEGLSDHSLGDSSSLSCTVTYSPPSINDAAAATDGTYYEVPVSCGATRDTLRLLPDETTIELRLFSDWTFVEAYFGRGRAVITEVPPAAFDSNSRVMVTSTAPVEVLVEAHALRSIWVQPEEVRDSPRVYPPSNPSTSEKFRSGVKWAQALVS